MTASCIKQIVIVGGGAAGWLTANHLACAMRDKYGPYDPKHANNERPQITLVESPNIPTIGVGEGTVPSIRDSLQYFGISETDLVQSCSATFKQSIEFVGWQPDIGKDSRHRYHHIFDYPSMKHQNAMVDWLQQGYEKASFEDSFSIQSHLIDRGLSPKKFTQAEYDGVCNYAYHFDAGKFGALLANNAVTKLGVIHKYAEISDIVANRYNGIDHLVTQDGEAIHADLFVDCSGGASLLLGNFLQIPFISKKDELFTDTALATQVQYEDKEQVLACSTIATAHSAGWIWDIGLSTRRGVGIVYSSSHMTQEEAEAELIDYIGNKLFDKLGTPIRKIDMNSGYHEKFWQGNCVAIGMSQGFVEPLEATGLLMFDKSAQLLAELVSTYTFLDNELAEGMLELEHKFNQQLRAVWDGVFDFIKLHYCTSTRSDSQFWRDHQNRKNWSPSLIHKLEKWSHELPSQEDFNEAPGVFNLANHLYVLFGMDFRPSVASADTQLNEQTSSDYHQQSMQAMSAHIAPELLAHRELIQQIQRYGLQRI